MWSQSTGTRTEVSIGSVTTEVGSNGGMGGIAYTHWFEEKMALMVTARGMSADVSTKVEGGNVSSVTPTIAPVLFGLKYYFPRSTFGGKVRPFASVLVGPFIGTQSSTEVGLVVATESRTETAIGGQLGAGIDIVLSKRFMLGLAVGYNLMSDFEKPIGGSKNYSGGEFTFGFGYLFGG